MPLPNNSQLHLLKVLKEPLSEPDLFSTLSRLNKVNHYTMRNALTKLVESGSVEEVKGKYQLTKKGRFVVGIIRRLENE